MKSNLTYFDRRYTGPNGPHLGSRTYFTINGRHQSGQHQTHRSIHNRRVIVT